MLRPVALLWMQGGECAAGWGLPSTGLHARRKLARHLLQSKNSVLVISSLCSRSIAASRHLCSNFGSYAVFFAARVGPAGAVHCFEPQRKMAQVMGG